MLNKDRREKKPQTMVFEAHHNEATRRNAMKTFAIAAVAAAGLALLVPSHASACPGGSAGCTIEGPAYKVAPRPKGVGQVGQINKSLVKKMCPSGWMWSLVKGRCINLFGGAHL